MINSILYMHAIIGLNNGVILEGFVQMGDGKYFKLVELDNSVVMVRVDDISFARLVGGEKGVSSNPSLSSYQPGVWSGKDFNWKDVWHPPLSDSQPAMRSVTNEVSPPQVTSDSNTIQPPPVSKPNAYPPHPFTRVYGPVKVYKPATEYEGLSKEMKDEVVNLAKKVLEPIVNPAPPQIELDEEGFAVGLPRGVTTMDYPFKAPSLVKVIK